MSMNNTTRKSAVNPITPIVLQFEDTGQQNQSQRPQAPFPVAPLSNNSTQQQSSSQTVGGNEMKQVFGVHVDPDHKRIIKTLDNGAQVCLGMEMTQARTTEQLINAQLPTNEDVSQVLQNLKTTMDSHTPQMSDRGKHMVEDIKLVLDSVDHAISVKNPNNMLQQFVSNANDTRKQSVLIETVKEKNKGRFSNLRKRLGEAKQNEETAQQTQLQQDKQKDNAAKQQWEEIVRDLRVLLLFLIKSGDCRKLIVDIVLLLQSMVRRFDKQFGDQITSSISDDLMNNQRSAASHASDEEVQLSSNSLLTARSTKNVAQQILIAPTSQFVEEQEVARIENLLNRIVDSLTKKPEYIDIMNKMFNFYEKMESELRKQSTELKETYEPTVKQQSQDYQKLLNELWTIVEQYCGQEEFTSLRTKLYELLKLFSKDEIAKRYLLDLRKYLIDCVQNPTVSAEKRREDMNKIILDGTQAFSAEKDKYHEHFEELASIAKKIQKRMKEDPVRKDISDKLISLMKNMVLDESGKPDIFVIQDSLKQLEYLLSNVLSDQLKNVPLPYLQYQSADIGFVATNMVLNASGILPQHVNLKTTSKFSVNTAQPAASTFVQLLQVDIDKVHLQLKDVHYQFQHKKLNILKDKGVVDIAIAGKKGFSLSVGVKLVVRGPHVHLELKQAQCQIEKLRFNFKRADHKAIDKMVTKMLSRAIKSKVCGAITEKLQGALRDMFTTINEAAARREAQLKQQLENQPQVLANKLNAKMKSVYDASKDLTLHDVKKSITRTVKNKKDRAKETITNLTLIESEESTNTVQSSESKNMMEVTVTKETIPAAEKTA